MDFVNLSAQTFTAFLFSGNVFTHLIIFRMTSPVSSRVMSCLLNSVTRYFSPFSQNAGECVWATGSWNITLCLLETVSLNHHQSFSDTVKIPWASHFARHRLQRRLTEGRAAGRKRELREEKRQMEGGRASHWVRVKYPEWGVRRGSYAVLPVRANLFGLDRIQEGIRTD